MASRTVFDNDNFELYEDKNGKFWLWNKKDETNAAIRAKSEAAAYIEAVNSLIFSLNMVMESRKEAWDKLEEIERCVVKVFGERGE